MSSLLKTVGLTIIFFIGIANLMVLWVDYSVSEQIESAKSEKRIEMEEAGASETEILSATKQIEDKLKLINLWHQSEFSDFLVISIESSFYGLIVGIFLYYFFVKRKHRKKLVFIVFLITLIPSLWRTYLYASDARGLILIAGIESSNLSFNPYQLDEDAIFLTPIASEWIFINIPSLYSSCGYYSRKLNKCDLPLVNYIGSILSNNGSSEVADRLYRILDELIKRGEPLNALYHGMAPLHLAIISNEPVYALALLSGGASLNQKVSKPGKSEDGFTALELLEHREKQVGKEYTELRNLFQRQ